MGGNRKGRRIALADSGLLIVVSGPSGAGKGTICDALRARFPQVHYSISMTTRPPRPGEKEGVNYYFTDTAHFEALLAQDAFLEHAKVYDHYYGTPKQYVYDALARGEHVLLEIDIQGAMQVRKHYPQCLCVYIVPPNRQVLAARLHGRHTDSEEVIAGRLQKTQAELAWMKEYDYVIVNDRLAAAIEQMEAIIRAEACRCARNGNTLARICAAYQE